MTVRDQFMAATDRLRGLASREAAQLPGHTAADLLSAALARAAVAENLNPDRARLMFRDDLFAARSQRHREAPA